MSTEPLAAPGSIPGGGDLLPVLIVGAGPAGLAAALELGHRGIRVALIEKQDRAGWSPRAKTTHVRSVEHMRRWGIAEALRAAAPLPADYPTDIVFKTRLDGYELAHFRNAFFGDRTRDERFSESAQWIPQYKVEGVLRDALAKLPHVSLHFGVEFLGLEDDGETVRVTATRENGAPFEIRARYVIGADGPRSPVRHALGIETERESGLGRHLNLIIRSADLSALRPQTRAIMYWITNPVSPSVLAPMDTGDLWAFMTNLGPDETSLPHDEISRRLFASVGAEVEFEIMTRDFWAAARMNAKSYGRGRVWLAGDAVHTHPPFGGYGMNMGIADAVDIGWKIAATLQGWGGPHLVPSYEPERTPVHERVMDEAVKNHAVLSHHFADPVLDDPGSAGDEARRAVGERIFATKANEVYTLGSVLGLHYGGSSLVVPDGSEAPPVTTTYVPSASPGCLAPHAWLADGSSLYDHFGQGFTLLVLADGREAEIEKARVVAAEMGVPLTISVPNETRLRDLYEADLALVRPDQYVAWRGANMIDAAAIFARVTGRD